ncbi:MAG: CxxC-x17-CxxC domain-containing protein [Candidatus Nomurabacteria bacterium]
MGNFNGGGNRGGGFRGGNGGGGRPSFGGGRGGDRGPVTMHKAVCDECHKSCEVPFRPSGDKPIYCNDCFGEKRGNEAPRRDFGNDRAPRREFNDRPAQTFSKPAVAPVSNDMSKQLGEMNSKLDRLINAIEKMNAPKVSAPAVVSKPVVKVAPVVVKVAPKAPAAKVVVKASAKKVVAKAPAKKIVSKKK